MRFLLLATFLVSCAAFNEEMSKRDKLNRAWRGKTRPALLSHPYLSTLRHSTHKNEERFVRRSPVQSKARCQALGGCQGFMGEGDCYHVFSLKHDVITDYPPRGDCYQETLELKALPFSN